MATSPQLGAGIVTLARLLPAISRPITASLVVTGIASAALAALATVVGGQVVGALPAAVEGGAASPAGRHFTILLGALGLVLLFAYVAGQLLGVLGGMVARRVDGTLRTRVLRACLRPAGLDHLHDTEVQSALALARDLSPAGMSPGAAASGLTPAVSVRLTSLLEAGVLVALGLWWVALPLVGARLVLEVGLMRLFFENLRGVTTAGLDFRRITWFRDLASTAPAAKEVRVFGWGRWIADRNRRAFDATMAPTWAARRRNGSRILGVSGTVGIAQLGGLTAVAIAALSGGLDLGAFVVAVGAVHGVLSIQASDAEISIAYGAAAVPAVLRLEQVTAEERFATPGTAPADGMPASEIRFEGVRFAYPGGEAVLDGLDLTIPAGQRLAVVGLNGAGKTTLIKLLCRLHEPDEGRITVDGVDLAELDPGAWRAQVGVLFQDFLRYQLPARDNVAFGAVDLRVGEAELDALAARVGATEVLARLDDGWDTPLSSTLTGGTDLSGGQWQRIALARAMLAVDAGARVLVLDEPTANLDVRAEADLYERFLELTAQGRDGAPLTSVVISHRFSTVRRADRIVVLDGGRVVEDGPHDELVALGGRYAQLFALQAARFADEDAPDVSDDELPEPAGA
ncbi:MAG TPA: ABC transporter ATP-binding protein [Acidimicrobiales bacterium]|nr:ABC transporter ATP-binding protein [Acidimicrobiales bacterium]